MLAGNWPYWKPDKITKHPDELLRARLNYADSNKSLVVQDLEALAEGLEGRSTNPVSLLVSIEYLIMSFDVFKFKSKNGLMSLKYKIKLDKMIHAVFNPQFNAP